MAAALPHCDALVSGHSLDALDEVVTAIAAERGEPPAYESEPDEETWSSATPVQGSSVAMPSGYGPSRGEDDTRLGTRWKRLSGRGRRASTRAASARRCPRTRSVARSRACDLEEHNALSAHQERQRLEREDSANG